MPLSGRKVPPHAVELESATVASPISGREVELPAMWNRMFEPRVLTDIGPEGFEAISALPGGESLEWCYGCGKCVPVCPVDMVGEYGPRKIHRKVQTGIDLLTDDDLWLCTTCGNCLRVCPKEVDMIQIMPAVREAALTQGAPVPAELQDVFEKTFRYGNALGENARRRAQWTRGAGVPVRMLPSDPSPVDVLFYVEDYWSYHPRGQQAAQAFARVGTALGVDWAILGHEEKTVGDSQRLAGEQGDGMLEHLAAFHAQVADGAGGRWAAVDKELVPETAVGAQMAAENAAVFAIARLRLGFDDHRPRAVAEALGLSSLGVSVSGSSGLGFGRYLTQNVYVSASQSTSNMLNRKAEVDDYLTPNVSLRTSASSSESRRMERPCSSRKSAWVRQSSGLTPTMMQLCRANSSSWSLKSAA